MKTFMMKTTSLVIALGAAILGSAPRARSQFISDCTLPIVPTDECPFEPINQARWTIPLIEQVLYTWEDQIHANVRLAAQQNNLDPFDNSFAGVMVDEFKLSRSIDSGGVSYEVWAENLTLPTLSGYSSILSSDFNVNYLCGNLTTIPATTYFEAYVENNLTSTAYSAYQTDLYARPTPPSGDALSPSITVKGGISDSGPAMTHFFVRGNATVDGSKMCIESFEEIKLFGGSAATYSVTGADALPGGYDPVSSEFQLDMVQVSRREGPPQVKDMWDIALSQTSKICVAYK